MPEKPHNMRVSLLRNNLNSKNLDLDWKFFHNHAVFLSSISHSKRLKTSWTYMDRCRKFLLLLEVRILKDLNYVCNTFLYKICVFLRYDKLLQACKLSDFTIFRAFRRWGIKLFFSLKRSLVICWIEPTLLYVSAVNKLNT